MTGGKNIYRTYVSVLLISLTLLGASVGVSLLNAGMIGISVNLLIAAVIAGLIATYYMGLRTSTALVRLFSSATLVWLMFMFVLTLADYLTRF